MSQPAPMSSRPYVVPPVNPPSRPGVLDFLFILCGCGISLWLVEWAGLHTELDEPAPAIVQTALKLHPYLLFLPQGILLLWPVFFVTQKLGGRDQPLSAGEWLWGLAWLAAVAFAGWITWRYLGELPEFLRVDSFAKFLGSAYMIFVASTGGIALLIWLIDLIGRWPQPWTHPCCLALLIWPALPLGAMLIWDLKLRDIPVLGP